MNSDLLAVKNSRHPVEMTRDVCIGKDDMLVSFDVSSLFTNVPADEAMKVIQKKTATGLDLGRQDGPLPRQNSGTT